VAPPWFKPRGYRHFDAPVGEGFLARASDSEFVAHRDWSPLIHYTKRTKRYKPAQGQTVYKNRPIMYASHRDACILSKYAHDLSVALDARYRQLDLNRNVIAYRQLGKANYDFSAAAARFALAISPCVVLSFDISGFFDHLDHGILKSRLRDILGVKEIPTDWYRVFRHVTAFSKIDRDDLAQHPVLGPNLRRASRDPIAPIASVKAHGIQIATNPNKYGVPQGTPISSAFSNLYMIELDKEVAAACTQHGALYQRYSDDILIVCRHDSEVPLRSALLEATSRHKLEMQAEKCERMVFDARNPASFQYLGFDVSPEGALVRPSSLAKQWRKLRREIACARRVGASSVATGTSTKIYTKKLRRKFSPIGIRNFSRYARRAASSFGSVHIRRQVLKLERAADREIRALNEPIRPPHTKAP